MGQAQNTAGLKMFCGILNLPIYLFPIKNKKKHEGLLQKKKKKSKSDVRIANKNDKNTLSNNEILAVTDMQPPDLY